MPTNNGLLARRRTSARIHAAATTARHGANHTNTAFPQVRTGFHTPPEIRRTRRGAAPPSPRLMGRRDGAWGGEQA